MIKKVEPELNVKQVVENVVMWGMEINLIQTSNTTTQFVKLISEFGELSHHLLTAEPIVDDVGDCMVVVIMIATIEGFDLTDQFEILLSDELELPKLSKVNLIGSCNLFLGKLADNVIKGQPIQDNLFGFMSSVSMIARTYGLDLKKCLEASYGVISKRKGVMYHGVFIKDDDPRYEAARKEIESMNRLVHNQD